MTKFEIIQSIEFFEVRNRKHVSHVFMNVDQLFKEIMPERNLALPFILKVVIKNSFR